MRVIAFVGPSGTGKSYRSVMVSQQYGADAIIDDGLLISHGKVIAGTSAKKEPTKIASVKHALFMNPSQVNEIKKVLKRNKIKCLMILGTSDGMVNKIAKNIGVHEIEQIIRIEDVATPEEMNMALRMRTVEGKHVIPVPTFEIKKEFSGYIISDNVINSIAIHEAQKIDGLIKVQNINLRKTGHGVHIDMTVILQYGCDIFSVCKNIQLAVRNNVEQYTSINARRINILVKNLRK